MICRRPTSMKNQSLVIVCLAIFLGAGIQLAAAATSAPTGISPSTERGTDPSQLDAEKLPPLVTNSPPCHPPRYPEAERKAGQRGEVLVVVMVNAKHRISEWKV